MHVLTRLSRGARVVSCLHMAITCYASDIITVGRGGSLPEDLLYACELCAVLGWISSLWTCRPSGSDSFSHRLCTLFRLLDMPLVVWRVYSRSCHRYHQCVLPFVPRGFSSVFVFVFVDYGLLLCRSALWSAVRRAHLSGRYLWPWQVSVYLLSVVIFARCRLLFRKQVGLSTSGPSGRRICTCLLSHVRLRGKLGRIRQTVAFCCWICVVPWLCLFVGYILLRISSSGFLGLLFFLLLRRRRIFPARLLPNQRGWVGCTPVSSVLCRCELRRWRCRTPVQNGANFLLHSLRMTVGPVCEIQCRPCFFKTTSGASEKVKMTQNFLSHFWHHEERKLFIIQLHLKTAWYKTLERGYIIRTRLYRENEVYLQHVHCAASGVLILYTCTLCCLRCVNIVHMYIVLPQVC